MQKKGGGKTVVLVGWKSTGSMIFLPRDLQDILTEMNSDDDEEYQEDDNETEQFSSDEESTCSDMDSSDTDDEN